METHYEMKAIFSIDYCDQLVITVLSANLCANKIRTTMNFAWNNTAKTKSSKISSYPTFSQVQPIVIFIPEVETDSGWMEKSKLLIIRI